MGIPSPGNRLTLLDVAIATNNFTAVGGDGHTVRGAAVDLAGAKRIA
ncbi:hypothetical protein [Halovibrio sp. HP20-59]|nr:hypothetical protein [Halovibrio sp. HP20-59]MEA2119723.1 hypothetical protein [Halovibrio sp. HP20-59]